MKQIQCLTMTFAAAVASAGALAHGGHTVPVGVPAEVHLHLAESVVVPGSVLITVTLAGVALGALLWRRRPSTRHGKTGQVDSHRSR